WVAMGRAGVWTNARSASSKLSEAQTILSRVLLPGTVLHVGDPGWVGGWACLPTKGGQECAGADGWGGRQSSRGPSSSAPRVPLSVLIPSLGTRSSSASYHRPHRS